MKQSTSVINILNNIRNFNHATVSDELDYILSDMNSFYYFVRIYNSLYNNNYQKLYAYFKQDNDLLEKYSSFIINLDSLHKFNWIINFEKNFFSENDLQILNKNLCFYSDELKEFWDSVEDGSIFNLSDELSEQLDRILAKNPNIADGI